MKINKMYFCRVPHQAFELMFGMALPEVASSFNAEYKSIEYKDSYRGFKDIPSTNDNVAVFFYLDRYHRKNIFDEVRSRCPNVFFVMIGGDIIYELGERELFYKDFGVDLYIDPHDFVIDELTNRGCLAKKLHLTLSRKFGEYCKNNRHGDRKTDFICLARHGTSFRKNFFNKIKDNFSLYTDLPELTTEDIINIYSDSKFTLGTTSPCHEEHKNYVRSLKGFRDWIGPLCGNVLVYDNYNQIIKDFGEIVPTYKYGDVDDLKNLYEDLIGDTNKYNILSNKQRNWIENNYLDDQLIKILGEI